MNKTHLRSGLRAGLSMLAVAGLVAVGVSQATAQDTVKMGLVTFMSGPASGHFGLPALNGAEITIDAINNGTLPPPYDTPGVEIGRAHV